MLYNEYRPDTFSKVIGQEWIVTTLRNAVRLDKVPHVILFSGPRGSGKTSLARILSKAVNCVSHVNGDPCLECVPCKEDMLNVFEVDAAVQRGVDDMDSIKTLCRNKPLLGKYRVVVVDECHQLTSEAMNSALKLFEEPPEGVIFVMCTTGQTNNPETKVAKAYETLISRCMQFSFTVLSPIEIHQKLVYICEQEDRDVSDDILRIISKKARGSLRDAESLMETVLSYTDSPIIVSQDIPWLTSTEDEKALEILEVLCSMEPIKSLILLDDIYQDGYNIATVASCCVEIAMDMMLMKQGSDIFYTKDIEDRLIGMSMTIDDGYLMKIIKNMSLIKKDEKTNAVLALIEIVLGDSEKEEPVLTSF
tara:strand:+ start:261 stop:1352 length:1092 start_codon:yes stop_codon:yes gene_type:complete